MRIFVRQFLFATLALMALTATAAERTVYLVPDAQGSPVAALDAQGNLLWRETYAPYGARTTKDSGNDARTAYTGKPEDSDTALVYMGARWYDPETARFTGIDPQGFAEGNPQSFGRYLYANNAPYRYVDPNGESPVDVAFLAYDTAVLAHALVTGQDISGPATDVMLSGAGVISPVPGGGQAMKAAMAAENASQVSRMSGAGGKTVLGHFPEYKNLADASGARFFNIPKDAWNKMSDAERWSANQKFLDRMISRGDEIILATPLNKVKPGSYFARELEYLGGKGYRPSDDGTRLIKEIE